MQRLRRQVAFDRFLARLFRLHDSDWVLKGGYAMELRFRTARTTRDSISQSERHPREPATPSSPSYRMPELSPPENYFSFRVNEATIDLDGAPYGGARYPVEAIMGGRTFVKFHLDVGIGDIIVDPVETAQTRDWLGFAGIESPTVPMIQREQQFAEKIHAYTLPRQGAPNSRVRDLVDLALLVRSGTLDTARVIESLQRTFARRNTHPLPTSLAGPPDNWLYHSPPWPKSAP